MGEILFTCIISDSVVVGKALKWCKELYSEIIKKEWLLPLQRLISMGLAVNE